MLPAAVASMAVTTVRTAMLTFDGMSKEEGRTPAKEDWASKMTRRALRRSDSMTIPTDSITKLATRPPLDIPNTL